MISYRVRGRGTEKTIHLRYRYNDVDFTFSTGKKIHKKYWKGGLPTKTSTYSKNLKHWCVEVHEHLEEELNARTDKNTVTKDWIKKQIARYELAKIESEITEADGKFEKENLRKEQRALKQQLGIKTKKHYPEDVVYWIDHIIENAPYRDNGKGGKGLSADRIRQYRNVKKFVKEFEKKKGITLLVPDVTEELLKDFELFLLKRNYQPQTAKKKTRDLKSVCREARSKGIDVVTGFETISVGTAKTYADDDMDVIYLDFDEIEQIQSLQLKSERLRNARKWLIALCYTGQRGVDLVGNGKYPCQLVYDNFRHIDGNLILDVHQRKGNKKVIVPVFEPLHQIYKDGLPYKITLQRLRDYFKELGELAGIDEPTVGKKQETTPNGRRGVKKTRPKYEYLSTHVGRRSFCTNFYGELPTPHLMKITGHAKETTLQKYINASTDDHIEEALNVFVKLKARREKKSDLQVIKKAN